MFDWDRFKNGEIAVHCTTEEKANDFLKECDRKGIRWGEGDRATHYNYYSVYCIENCYHSRENGLGYCDTNHFKRKGIEVIKWEIGSMKELTFKEVIANIKEGEVWELDQFEIKCHKTTGTIVIRSTATGKVFGFEKKDRFKLKRKEYTFEEAFKAYEEGKEIESKESSYKFKIINKKDSYLNKETESWIMIGSSFEIKEIRGKWYIND